MLLSVLLSIVVVGAFCNDVAVAANEAVSTSPTEQLATNNNTYNASLPLDDKGFWEWLYGLVTAQPIVTTTTTPPPEPQKCSSCSCGLTNTQKRIVGGVETRVNQYPWMALLKYKKRFYCGGSIINSKYVLTAAHCVDRFDATLISVLILEHDRNSSTESETQEFKVEKVIKHGGYSTVNFNNDIALLKITGEFKFEDVLRPVCLPEKGKTYSGSTGIATGWGAVEEAGPVSTTLREVVVPILTNNECRETKYPARKITDNMICAGYQEGSKDSCQGDSGGPLHVLNDKVHHVVGVVSWGEGCAQPGYPGVYSRVNRYLTWIKYNTLDACYC